MKFAKIAVLATAVFFSSSAIAEDKSPSPNEPNYFLLLLIGEAVIGVNAYLASIAPHPYGTISALAFPLAAINGRSSETARWVMLGSAEAIALYNIRIDENKKSRSDIFKSNVIAWHAFLGISLTTAYFTGDLKDNKRASLAYIPEAGGGRLLFSYRF